MPNFKHYDSSNQRTAAGQTAKVVKVLPSIALAILTLARERRIAGTALSAARWLELYWNGDEGGKNITRFATFRPKPASKKTRRKKS
jgi:hypothetical protein